jgi:hypothetical protein
MNIKKTLFLLLTLMLSINLIPTSISMQRSEMETQIIREAQSLIPTSIQMADNAIEVLDGGLANLSTEERALFESIFDPGATGSIDQAYVDDVLRNYVRIRRRLDGDFVFSYASESSSCRGMRLYYTNYFTIYICPYFLEEDKDSRKARTLIHEVAHIELLVLDRSYYDPNSYSARYHELSPRAPGYTEIPLVGHILREIQRKDTLYHPDAYAWFAGLLLEH